MQRRNFLKVIVASIVGLFVAKPIFGETQRKNTLNKGVFEFNVRESLDKDFCCLMEFYGKASENNLSLAKKILRSRAGFKRIESYFETDVVGGITYFRFVDKEIKRSV